MPFPYRKRQEVKVYVDWVERAFGTFTFTSPSIIQLPDGDAGLAGKVLFVGRRSDVSAAAAVFSRGGLSEKDLNNNQTQALFALQELRDDADRQDGNIRQQAAELLEHGRQLILQDQRIDALGGIVAGVPFPIDGLEFRPEQFGGNIQAAADAAWAVGGALRLRSGISYPFATLDLKPGLVVRARGATLARTGSVGSRNSYITIGNGVCADGLAFTFDGNEQGSSPSARLIDVQDNFSAETLSLWAASSLGYNKSINGVVSTGKRTRVGMLVTSNIDYPLMLHNTSTTELAEGSYIGTICAESYLRPFYAIFCSFQLGGVYARGRSANADAIGALDGGRYISNLLEGCERFRIGFLHCEDSGHILRIGGSPHANAKNRKGTIGNIYGTNTRGCAFKIAPSRLAEPGVTETAEDIVVGNITVIDCGDGVAEGNRDVVRITHGRNIRGGRVSAFKRNRSFSGQTLFLLNDCDGVEFEGGHADRVNSAAVVLSATSDVDGVNTFKGPLKRIRIGGISGEIAGTNLVAFENDFADISIGLAGVRGWSRLHASFGSPTQQGDVLFHGWVGGDTLPNALNPGTDPRFLVDVSYKGRNWSGSLNAARWLASQSVTSGTVSLDVDPADDQFGTFFAAALRATQGDASRGGSFIVSRPGSVRRGGGFAAKQFGSTAANVGLVFLITGTGANNSDALAEAFQIWPNGDIELLTTGRGVIAKSPDGTRYKLVPPNGGGAASWVAA